MYMSLEQILRMVANDKELKNPKKWIEDRLNHCEVHSDYKTFIHLKSHNRMWFGIRDTKFECQPFIMYREMINNEEVKEIHEFEIYTFQHLQDPLFNDLVKESFKYYYDTIKDIRLFHNGTPVFLRVKNDNGVVSLGEYNDFDEVFEIETSLYSLKIKDSNIFVYSAYKENLELDIFKLRAFFKEVEEGVWTSDIVLITKLGEPIKFDLLWNGQEWSVRWYDED